MGELWLELVGASWFGWKRRGPSSLRVFREGLVDLKGKYVLGSSSWYVLHRYVSWSVV